MPAEFSIADLYDSIDTSDERLGHMLRQRTAALAEYGGPLWMAETAGKAASRPLNLLRRGIKLLVAHLAARNPSYEASTERLQFRGEARKLSKQLEVRAEKAGTVQFSRRVLLDAFLGGRAVVRIGEKAGAEGVKVKDRFIHRGEVYRYLVSLDNWIVDPAATSMANAYYEGERYTMSRAKARAAVDKGIFGVDATQFDAQVLAAQQQAQGQMQAMGGQQGQPPAQGWDDALPPIDEVASPDEAYALIESASSIQDVRHPKQGDKAKQITEGETKAQDRHSLVDEIELVDLAVYVDAETTLLLTFLSDRDSKNGVPKYLRAEVWDGPARGPYEHLEFDPVPDNPHGPSMAMEMREQSEIANSVIGKMVEQIKRTRRVLAYQKQRAADALKITTTKDGHSVGIDGNPNEMKEFDLGGLSADLAPFAQLIIGYWNMQGSYDVLGSQAGGPARTAQEDSRLSVNANILIESLGDLHDEFHTSIVRHEAWYFLEDPFIKAPMVMRAGGFDVDVVYSAQDRMGTFADFTFKIKPRSMQRVDPAVKAAQTLETVKAVAEMAVLEAQTGGLIDAKAVARKLGRAQDIEDLDEIIRDPQITLDAMDLYAAVPPPTQGMPGQETPGASGYGARPRTTRGGPGGQSNQQMRQSVNQSAYAPMRQPAMQGAVA